MKLYFECTFESQTKQVKSFLKENGYALSSKRMKNYKTIIIDPVTKEYIFDTSYFFGSMSMFWLFKSIIKNNFN